MAQQEQQDRKTQGREVERQYSSQGNLIGRAGYPTGFLLGPGDFFRMSPFSLMRRMGEEMDRVLGEFGMNRGETSATRWAPAIEVHQTDGNYQIRAELPGIDPADVKLEVTDDAVILEGERKAEKREKQGGIQVCERQYGRFYRAIPLPEGAQVDQAKARFNNGVVEVTVPVQEPTERRRQIPIESGTSTKPEPSRTA